MLDCNLAKCNIYFSNLKLVILADLGMPKGAHLIRHLGLDIGLVRLCLWVVGGQPREKLHGWQRCCLVFARRFTPKKSILSYI